MRASWPYGIQVGICSKDGSEPNAPDRPPPSAELRLGDVRDHQSKRLGQRFDVLVKT